jgi:hypothetical protein
MKMWRAFTLTIVLVTISMPWLAEVTAWLPTAVRSAVVVLAPPVAMALALVLYFDWRTKFKRQILADDRRDDELAGAASSGQPVITST